jgi:outer membrane receptor for ferric coprogen and ferric-rhodotorulic acid
VQTPHRYVSARPNLLAALLGSLIPAIGFSQVAPSVPPAVRTTAAEDAVQLGTFTVREDQDIGYESMQTTSGSRTVQELKNVANSISILNKTFMDDIGALTIDEVMRWSTSGEDNPEPFNVQVDSRVVLRGVANAYAMRNGWIWYSPMDAYNTERVEVLRGPNSFLYGEADVGGAQKPEHETRAFRTDDQQCTSGRRQR